MTATQTVKSSLTISIVDCRGSDANGDLFVNADMANAGDLRVAVVDEDTAEELEHFSRDDSGTICEDVTRTDVIPMIGGHCVNRLIVYN